MRLDVGGILARTRPDSPEGPKAIVRADGEGPRGLAAIGFLAEFGAEAKAPVPDLGRRANDRRTRNQDAVRAALRRIAGP